MLSAFSGDEVPTTRWQADPRCADRVSTLGLASVDDLHGWFVARLARRDEDGFWPHEQRLGVATKPAGWRRELARAWAMIVLFQISFFIINIAPAILGRALFGGPSALVP